MKRACQVINDGAIVVKTPVAVHPPRFPSFHPALRAKVGKVLRLGNLLQVAIRERAKCPDNSNVTVNATANS